VYAINPHAPCCPTGASELKFRDSEKNRFLVTAPVYDLFVQLPDGIASPLGGNPHAGVEDQSHGGGFSGSRWLLMTSSRSRAKSSSSVAVEACSPGWIPTERHMDATQEELDSPLRMSR
jgi:hypothetical protein